MRVFRVTFVNQGKVYEIYAKRVQQGELYGFVQIEELVFQQVSAMLVDPAEERLKSEFQGVSRSLIPIHAVIRIDEVEKQGQSKILELGEKSNVALFPTPLYPSGRDRDN